MKESTNCVNSIYGGGDVVFTWSLDNNISTCESVYIRIPLSSKARKSSTIATDSIKSATPHYKLGSLSLQIRAVLFYYKLGQDVITGLGRLSYDKLGQFITYWGSYYKIGQNLLQIGTAITSEGSCYKLEHGDGLHASLTNICCY